MASKCQGQAREKPEHKNGIHAGKLTFWRREDGDDPSLVPSEFRHPAQPIQVTIQLLEIVVNIVRFGTDGPCGPSATVFAVKFHIKRKR